MAGTSTRSGPLWYQPSQTLVLTNEFAPLADESGPNTLIETVPVGWSVGIISDGGSYSATEHAIRWIFFGNSVRTITWELKPPASAGLNALLSGTSAFGAPGKSVSQPVTGVASISLKPRASGVATRVLPASYRPGQTLAVAISMVPEVGVAFQVVEEQPPVGWAPLGISDSGSYQAGKIRWGPFTDGLERTLSYQLTPANTTNGTAGFSGSAQFGDSTVAIGGGKSMVRGPDPSGSLTRSLQPTYRSGVGVAVSLRASPDNGVTSWGVIENLPAGWRADAVSDLGSVSADGKTIRWGPFLDGASRVFSYQAVPGGSVTGNARFVGTGDFGGITVAASGTTQVSWVPPASGVLTRWLPSVVRPGATFWVTNRVEPDPSVTGYSVEEILPTGCLVVAPADGIYNSATHSLRWGPFFDNTAREWVYRLSAPSSVGLLAFSGRGTFGVTEVSFVGSDRVSIEPAPQGKVSRTLPAQFRPGYAMAVSLSVTPDAGVSLQVIEEVLPEGWAATAVSDGGTYDAALRRVRWGLFADDKNRVLRYSAVAPEGLTGKVTIAGLAAFDGQSVNTGGASQSQANGPPVISALPALSVLEDQTVRITFTVTDDQTPLGELVVNARGSNDALAPPSELKLRRNGGVYGLDIGLVPETAGRVTVTIQAGDGTYQTEKSFDLEVSLTNDTPKITPPTVAAIVEDSSVRIGSWEVRDPDAGDGVLEMTIQVSSGSLKLDSLGGAVLVSGANGSAALSLRGTLFQLNQALLGSTLTPSPNHNGIVQVQISVNDLGNTGGLDPQTGSSTLSVSVTGVNDAPTFTLGSDQSAVQGSGGRTVLGWATNIRPGPLNESGQAVRFMVSADPASLFLVPPAISPDGTLTYTPAVSSAGSAIVTVQLVDDGGTEQGGSSESTLERFEIVVLDPVNNPPTLSTFSDRTVPEETLLTIPFTIGDDRTDSGSLAVTVSSSNADLVPNSALVLGGSGASRTLLVRLDVEAAGQSVITLQVDDGTYRVRRGFILTVQAVNDLPILTAIADRRIDEGETLSFSLSASDADVPVQALTYARVSGPAGLSVSSSGLVSWTPSEAQGPATETVTVFVTDGVATATRSFTVEVREVNEAPSLPPIVRRTVPENELISIRLGAGDVDIPAQNLRYLLLEGPVGAQLNEGGEFLWTPTERQGPTTNLVRVAVTDGQANVSTSFTIVVQEVNQPPSFVGLGDVTIAERLPYSLLLSGSDPDVPQQALSFRLLEGPAGSEVTNGVFYWEPGAVALDVPNRIRLAISDGLVSVTNEFRLTVSRSRVGPTFVGVTNAVIPEGVLYRQTLRAAHPQLPESRLSISLVSGPPGSLVTSNVFSWTPTEAQGPSAQIVRIAVSDGELSATNSVVLSVQEVNQPPVPTPLGTRRVSEGSLLSFTVGATDADLPAQRLIYSAVSAPAGVTVSSNGVVSWRPTEAQGPSTNVLLIRVTDDGNPELSATNAIDIVVREVNTAPVLDGLTNRTVKLPGTVSLALRATDADLPSQALTYGLVSGPTGLTVSPSGELRWTPTEAQARTTNAVTVSVSDGVTSASTGFVVVVEASPRLSLQVTGGNAVVIQVAGPAGALCRLEQAETATGAWTPVVGVADLVTQGFNTPVPISIPGPLQTGRLYRLRVL